MPSAISGFNLSFWLVANALRIASVDAGGRGAGTGEIGAYLLTISSNSSLVIVPSATLAAACASSRDLPGGSLERSISLFSI